MTTQETIDPKATGLGEDSMVSKERWTEIRRLAETGATISALARQFDLDRKTVRDLVRKTEWRPYRRAATETRLLSAFEDFVRDRAAAVHYSAQILYQELRQRGYTGSYVTVRRFVRPLREAACRADLTRTRFETAPGEQSQIDWGQARVWFGTQPVVRHIFVLTLGYSRRSVYVPCCDEAMGSFLDAHETAFEYFGGHTAEHLYDRARTVCHPLTEGGSRWNATFKAFAAYWSFEPRLCQPYRAQTKGKVESGVKYFRRNFLPGRTFRDDTDLGEQLAAWTHDVADVRVHGTTHERPIDRFVTEAPALVATAGHAPFRHEAVQRRIVATDYLVSFETNRYSVPFRLIGQEVEVRRQHGQLEIRHRGTVVAAHALLDGKYQLRILPEHGPGPIARTQRTIRSTPASPTPPPAVDVEVRDLATYERLCLGGAQ